MSTGLPPGHLAVSNGGTKGTWGPPEFCSAGHHAKGFSIKVEKGQKPTKDHVALTGVGLLCTDSNLVTSAQGRWVLAAGLTGMH
nr:PREDICTED: vitelline membrane outer layer protein 1 homolog [Struthio camelus australis]